MYSAGQGLTKVWVYVMKTCLRYLRGLPIIEAILSGNLSDDWASFSFPGITHMSTILHNNVVDSSSLFSSVLLRSPKLQFQ